MTKSEFNHIQDINNKADEVWTSGEFIDERIIYSKFIIKIYSLSNFFVEVWVDIPNNKIEKIIALEDERDWSGYLNSIKIEELF